MKSEKEVGLEIGDVITQINGIPVETLGKKKNWRFYPASNLTSKLERHFSADLLPFEIPNSNKKLNTIQANATLQKNHWSL